MATKKRLGRNMSALLAGSGTLRKEAEPGAATQGDLRELSIELLQRGKYQPRTDMHAESLEDLADSIRQQGIVQPIIVRAVDAERYEIIAGERRWRAAQLAGLQSVPVVIRDVADDAAIAMALIENIQRENLNPLEEATALKRLIDEFELTHQEAAQAVGRSRAAVSNLLRLLELNSEVKKMLTDGLLEMGHARALLSLPSARQGEGARLIAHRGLSVREAERLVKKMLQEGEKPKAKPARVDPDIARFEQNLSAQLGAKVAIQHTSNGKGKLVINYNNLDELEGILEHIN
jgi:ParB family chromosome partitioning protein